MNYIINIINIIIIITVMMKNLYRSLLSSPYNTYSLFLQLSYRNTTNSKPKVIIVDINLLCN